MNEIRALTNRMLERFENLEKDYLYDQQVINDIIESQEQFIDYLKNKMESDKNNEKIYKEIKEEFEKMII